MIVSQQRSSWVSIKVVKKWAKLFSMSLKPVKAKPRLQQVNSSLRALLS